MKDFKEENKGVWKINTNEHGKGWVYPSMTCKTKICKWSRETNINRIVMNVCMNDKVNKMDIQG